MYVTFVIGVSVISRQSSMVCCNKDCFFLCFLYFMSLFWWPGTSRCRSRCHLVRSVWNMCWNRGTG